MRRLPLMNTSRLFAVLVVGAALSAPAAAQSPAKYVLTDLGTLGGVNSSANDINNLGQVTGTSATTSGPSHAYRTAPNSVITPADDLGTLGGSTSTGERINDSGQVAGSSSNGTNTHAFRSSANNLVIALTDLGTFDGTFNSFGSGIDSLGRVTGSAHVAGTAACFFIFSNSAFRTTAGGTVAGGDNLGTLVPSNCRSAQGWAINDLGVVVGDSATQFSTGVPNHAFRASPGSAMVNIHPAGAYDSSIAVDINSAGQIVGTVTVGAAFSPTAQHCYRTTPGQSIQLPADSLGSLGGPGPFCSARGINADGDVVGSSSTGSQIHAFIYTDGTMSDLNSLIGPTTVVLTQATGINDSGQISAQGWTNGYLGGVLHSFRLDPFDLATDNFLELLSDPDLELTSGQSNSLIDKFTNVLASIAQGANKQAINQLNALVSSVESWLKSGKVSSETASTLITAANAISAAL
ncbi:MAG: FIMAH domain-containing protein [Vicinamibacterales bacterium]